MDRIDFDNKYRTMRDYLRIILKYKITLFLTVLTFMGAAFIGLELKTPVYEAKVKMLIFAAKRLEASYYRELVDYRNTELALTQSEIVTSDPVIERVVSALELYKRPLDYEKFFSSALKDFLIDVNNKNSVKKIAGLRAEEKEDFLFRRAVEGLKKKVKIELIRDTDLFNITVKDFDAAQAAIIANSISRSYCVFDLEQQLAEISLKYGQKHPIVKQLQKNIDTMLLTLEGQKLSNVEAMGSASIKIIEQATPPIEDLRTSKELIYTVSVIVSVLLGIMLSFAFEYFDESFKSPQEIEAFLNLKVLGSIAKKRGNACLSAANLKDPDFYSLSYQKISSEIYSLMKNKDLKPLLISGASRREGASTAIANLGLCMAERLNLKTLIIDTNFRNPSIKEIFKIENKYGLNDALKGKVPFEEAVYKVNPNLDVLPAFKAESNLLIFLNHLSFSVFLKKAAGEYDMMLIDCANMNDFNNTDWLPYSGAAVLVVMSEGIARRQALKRILADLREKKINFIGALFNKRTFVIPNFIYKRV